MVSPTSTTHGSHPPWGVLHRHNNKLHISPLLPPHKCAHMLARLRAVPAPSNMEIMSWFAGNGAHYWRCYKSLLCCRSRSLLTAADEKSYLRPFCCMLQL